MNRLKQIEERLDDTFGNQRTTPYDLFITKKIREKIKQFISAQITQILEELREPNKTYFNRFKLTNTENYFSERDGAMFDQGYNQRNQILNDKIDKILNK